MTAPDEMATLWRELGMVEVEQISLLIRMEFSSFEDYWRPFTTGVVCGRSRFARPHMPTPYKSGPIGRGDYPLGLASRSSGPRVHPANVATDNPMAPTKSTLLDSLLRVIRSLFGDDFPSSFRLVQQMGKRLSIQQVNSL